MKNTKFFTLGFADLIKGFIVAILGAFIAGILDVLNTHQFPTDFAPILYSSLASGLAYLLKNLVTNSDDEFLIPEKK